VPLGFVCGEQVLRPGVRRGHRAREREHQREEERTADGSLAGDHGAQWQHTEGRLPLDTRGLIGFRL
jgi:hypothetical protein